MFDGGSVIAYMLIVVEHGAEEEVLKNLTEIESVEEASLVLGEYDIHCRLKVNSMKEMREILARVRKLRILTSETLIVIKKASRVKRITNRHIRKLGHKRARH